MMTKDQKKIIFLELGLLVLFLVFGFHEVLFSDFYGIHSWRQSDCLSIAYHYYQGNSFLEPEIHNLISDNNTSGKSAGEFPILYWLIGNIWALTAYSEPVYRILVLLLTLAGFYFQYLSLKVFFKSTFFAFGLTLITFSTPLVLFYGTSFLTNMPSLSFAQIGCYCFYIAYQKKKNYFLHLGILSFVLAGLLKITALSTLIIILPIAVYTNFRSNKLFFVSLLLGIGILYWWYGLYVPKYTELHGGKYTFNSLWPIWKMTNEEIVNSIKFFRDITFWQLMNPLTWILFFFSLLVCFLIKGKIGKFFIYATISLLIGFGLYFILWFNAVHHHDYYFINFIIVPIFILSGGIYFIKERFSKFYYSKKLKYIFSLLIIFSVMYGANNLRMRYKDRLNYWKGFAIATAGNLEPGYWDYMTSALNVKKIKGIDKWLDKNQVSRNDKIVSLSDPSFCIDLYSTKRKGFTLMNFQKDPRKLESLIKKGAKYAITSELNDTALYSNFLGDFIGEYNGTYVYKTK